MKMPHALLLAIPLCLATSAGAAPREQQPKPQIFDELLQCRTISDDTQRLACFDRRVAAMDSAAQRDEVVVLDKAELGKTRRTLFGFTFPKLPFLGDDDKKEDKDAEGYSHIESTIAAARNLGNGKWEIELEDGARWVTTEVLTFRDPKPGTEIEIRRAAMGSYLGKFSGNARAIRMRRTG